MSSSTASSNPPSGPTASSNSPSVPATPVATSNQSTYPTMGSYLETNPGSKVYNYLVGGKPNYTWDALDNPVKTPTLFHYRPINPVQDAKGFKARSTGFHIKFTRSSNLPTFSSKVSSHLRKHGLDTITYLQNPSNQTEVLDVVNHHPRFILDKTRTEASIATLCQKWDTMDRANDAAACAFLLDSLDDSLKLYLDGHFRLRTPTFYEV